MEENTEPMTEILATVQMSFCSIGCIIFLELELKENFDVKYAHA